MTTMEFTNTTTVPNLNDFDDIQELRALSPEELQLVSGGDIFKATGLFGLAGGIGYSAFGAYWGAVAVGAAVVASPITVGAMVGLAAWGGYELLQD